MADKVISTKRIIKNTGVLYIRSIVVLLITLYTSRVVLKELGVDDYGLFNVIGGVIGLFAFLRTSLTKSTQRFLNTAMVNQDDDLNRTFCVSMNIHIGIAIVALLLCESVGLWFLHNFIQVPSGREMAANIVFQSTICSLLATIISVPYSAAIIAHEDMGYLAVVSIADALLKLLISFSLVLHSDRLILYGYLMAGVSLINFVMYSVYCRQKYDECRYHVIFDRLLTKKMFGYTSWTIVGQMAIIGTNQGNNILVNMFHSVSANAAMGVSSQVNQAIVSLTSNFQTAFNPQITKAYASGETEYLRFLVFSTSKLSYILLTVVSIPIMFNINAILDVWLDVVPQYCGIFCILFVLNSILNAFSTPFNFCVLSSGKIKWFQIVSSLVYLSDLLIVYVFFCLGCPPYFALVVKIGIMFVILFVRVYFAQREVPCINGKLFLKKVCLPLLFATFVPVILGLLLFNYTSGFYWGFVNTLLIVVLSLLSFYFIGLSSKERQYVEGLINKVRSNK